MLNYIKKNLRSLFIVFLWIITVFTSMFITISGNGRLVLVSEFVILIFLLKLVKFNFNPVNYHPEDNLEKEENKKTDIKPKSEFKEKEKINSKEKVIKSNGMIKKNFTKYTYYLRNGKKEIIEAKNSREAFKLFKFTNIPFKEIEFSVKNKDDFIWDLNKKKWIQLN